MRKIFPIDYTEKELRKFISDNNNKIKTAISRDEKDIINKKIFLAQNQLLIISNIKINEQIIEQNKDIKEGLSKYKKSISKSKKLTYIMIFLAILSNALNTYFFLKGSFKEKVKEKKTINRISNIDKINCFNVNKIIIKKTDTLNINNDKNDKK